MRKSMKTLRGKVVKGMQRGKDLGFPTANIAVHSAIEEGIYLAKVIVQKQTYNALTFIGKAVTFNETQVKAESYLLDFSGDLYGKYITVQILKKLRGNKKFDSAESLVVQMNEDVLNARKFFAEWC